jgi:hypothetical protein
MILERKDGHPRLQDLDVYREPSTALTLPKELTLEGYHILRGKARIRGWQMQRLATLCSAFGDFVSKYYCIFVNFRGVIDG